MSELRALATDLELRGVPGQGAQLIGYASRFNAETVIGGMFREQVAPGAFKRSIKNSDIRALANHDTGRVVGRSRGGPRNLALNEDGDGLYTVLDVPDTPTARSLYADIEHGLIDGMSFAFDVVREQWIDHEDAMPLRTLREVKLYEVSYVTFPAYETSSVEARGILVARAAYDPQEEREDDLASTDTATTQNPDADPDSPEQDCEHHSEPTSASEPTYCIIGT